MCGTWIAGLKRGLITLWEIMLRLLNNVAFLQSSTCLLQNVESYLQPYFVFENIYANNLQ